MKSAHLHALSWTRPARASSTSCCSFWQQPITGGSGEFRLRVID